MANDYVTVQDFYEIVELDPEKYGTIMQFMLDSSAKHIDNICKRKKDGFLSDTVASARLFTGSGNETIRIDECTEITTVKFKYHFNDTYTTMVSGDYIAFSGSADSPDFNNTPYTHLMINPNGDYSYWPYVTLFGENRGFQLDYRDYKSKKTPVYPSIEVTAKWGYSATVPDIIKNCVIIQATRYVKRAQGAYSDAIGNADTGQMFFTRKIDNDIVAMLYEGGMIKASKGIGSKK